MSVPEEWGVENSEGIYVLSEENAREIAEGNEDQTLMYKIDGEWIEVAAGS